MTCSLPCSLMVRADLSEQALEVPGEKPEEGSQNLHLFQLLNKVTRMTNLSHLLQVTPRYKRAGFK